MYRNGILTMFPVRSWLLISLIVALWSGRAAAAEPASAAKQSVEGKITTGTRDKTQLEHTPETILGERLFKDSLAASLEYLTCGGQTVN